MAKSRLIYVFSLLFAWSMALFFETAVGFILVYALLLLPALSFASLLLASLLIGVEQDGGGHALVKGDIHSLRIKVVNKGLLFYPRVQLLLSECQRVRYSPADAFSLGGRQRVELGLTALFPYRGVFAVGAGQLVLHDFMGLFRFTLSLPQGEPVLVYPKKAEGFRLPLTQEEVSRQNARNSQLFAQLEEISDLRQYAPQDDSRKIHWKASAKREQLIVKEYQGPAPQTARLILDTHPLSRGGPGLEDYMTALAATAIEDCLHCGLTPVLTCGPQGESVAVQGAGGLIPAWAALACATFDTQSELEALLQKGLPSHWGFTHLIVITARLQSAALAGLERLCLQGHDLCLIYVHPQGLPPSGQIKGQLHGLEALGAHITVQEGPEEQEKEAQ